MTKNDMESYYAITKDIEKLNEKYERSLTVAQDTVKGSSNVFPYTQRTFRISGVDNNNAKSNDIKVLLIETEMKRDVIYQNIVDFISTVDDAVMRNILYDKYIDFMSLSQIADKLRDCGYQITRDSVKKRLNRFWKQTEKNNGNP